ncbi:HTH-type transcriptional regulator CbbR [Beijerinckiaceae bacterium RH AL1]|jgi:LysR family transcriptional regulator, low CO2-responsive transcriptional regulator|nr:LysR family transcriptional regulator [Beijerinckiaceae bacterium]VVB46419.1 HTH-type transcriptional regulator CbbR [Beijerinckiaceae bacterium RH CH11]VVB46504.1 HTH-type transcriptional regulator CbbR [Beijerinckiaceae bacterium RH AL8]VVC55365.1 HTH-type transcriptional regulator CbbR [Beijerinckiaceae bacterium RH AL1]
MRRLTLKQLQTVRAVAESGTIATAADILRVTPAALTARIKLLESDVGLAFFDRAGGRLRLTDAGQEVVNTTIRMEMLLVELGNTLAAIKGKHAGRIAVGIISTAKYFATRLVAAYSKQNPRIELQLAIGNRQETIRALRDYGIDIALMGQPPTDFQVISQAIGAHPQVLVAPADHPLVGRRGLEKEDLAKESFIIREEGSGTRTVFDYFFDGGSRPAIKFEIGSNETIKQAVMAGLGLSLISAHTIEAEVSAGRLAILDVKGLPIIRQWYLVRRANWTPTPVGEAIWDFAAAHAAEFMPHVAMPEPVLEDA